MLDALIEMEGEPMPIIEVDDLVRTFSTRERAAGVMGSLHSLIAPRYQTREAVKGITFALEMGEVLAFIGPNGAGKSTTIKMLTGILHPSLGHAHVLGMVPWRDRQRLAYHIASVFGQKSQLWYHLPPQDTFDLLARIYELDDSAYRQRRAFLVDVFDIASHMRTPARKLSLGERMRCELAAALLHKPSIVFLDEPTIGLDVIAKQRIRELIAHLNTQEHVTVFLTSHDAGDIEQVCRRAIVVNHGEIILDTSVTQMKRDYLRSKTIDLLLDEPAVVLLDADAEKGTQRLALDLTGDEQAISIKKVSGHTIQLQVDTSRHTLEPVIAAIMQRCHIVDMTITDPPMEEIIAAIYGAQHNGRTDAEEREQVLQAGNVIGREARNGDR